MNTELDKGLPIVDKDGRMTERFWFWMLAVTRQAVLTGSGSPEGVIEAEVGRLYMNTAGTAGSILYIKRDADVSGDRTQGWILV